MWNCTLSDSLLAPTTSPPQRSPLRAEGIRNAHRWQAESSAAPNGPSAWTLVLCFSRHYLVHQHSLCFLWEKMKMRATNDSKLCYLCSPEGWDSQKSLRVWEDIRKRHQLLNSRQKHNFLSSNEMPEVISSCSDSMLCFFRQFSALYSPPQGLGLLWQNLFSGNYIYE